MLLPRKGAIVALLAALCGGPEGSRAQEEVPLSIEELLKQGRFEEALPLVEEREAEWNIAVRANDELERRMRWAQSLLLLGMVEDRLNKYEQALQHIYLARDLAEEGLADSSFLGDIYDALGKAEHKAGQFREAETSLLTAIEQRRRLDPSQREPWFSASRDHLGLLYLEWGRYQEAGRIFHETLAAAGDDKEVLAQRHSNLGKYFHTMKSFAKACEHLERALDSAREAWGEEDPAVISLTGQLGLAYYRLGSRDGRARLLLQRAVDLARNQPETHQMSLALATYLGNLAELSLREGKDEEARQVYTESLNALTVRLGDRSPVLAPFYNNIGYANQRLGEFEEAQQAFHQAAIRYEHSAGKKHQRYLESKLNLVENLFLAHGPGEATAREIRDVIGDGLDLFESVLAFGTQRQRLNWRERVNLVSLPCSLGSDPVFIADTLLRTKARLLDSLLSEEDSAGELLTRFRVKQRQLDEMLFRFESREALKKLRDEVSTTEAELLDQLSANRQPEEAAPEWTAIQATLPRNSAFVDYVRYENYNAGADGPLSYGAVLHLPDGEPRWIPLGSEEELTIWLRVLKERLEYRTYLLGSRRSTTPPALRLSSALRGIHDLFWAPIAARLPPGTETIGLSPDASLNFVSFAVLLDEHDQFLAHKFRQIVYTSSGRDLLVQERRPHLQEGPWAVIAVPEFAAPAPRRDEAARDALAEAVLETISSFQEVPGAREEFKLLRGLIPPGARGTELMNASEREVRAMTTSPVVLHLTTHGFFLPGFQDEGVSGVQDFDQQPDRLYRSGLVLTEAKQALTARINGEDVPIERDGILFADEVKDLPLGNTRLVTLSSCESGLGESVSGEGVLGLRRGFTLAGATNILISLWPVSDNSTPKFMERMYRLSLATDHLGQSLWETQRRMLETVDPGDDDELEEAVLRYGCFVLCQRGPLQAAAPMPDLRKSFKHWWAIALAVTGLFLFLITRSHKRPAR